MSSSDPTPTNATSSSIVDDNNPSTEATATTETTETTNDAPPVKTEHTVPPPLTFPVDPVEDDANSTNKKTGLTAKGDQRQFVKHCYHDRGDEQVDVLTSSDENTLRLYREDNIGGPFPIKLQILLKVMEKMGQQHIISWLPHGRSFMIHRPHEFEGEIMQKFFKQTKLTSFRRQLNLYDFQRITHGRDAGSYYHELFLRGKPLLAKRMIRRKVKGTKIRASSSPDDEPNFYSMPFMGPIGNDGSNPSGPMGMMNQGGSGGPGNMMPGSMNDGSMPHGQYMNNPMAYQQQQGFGHMQNQFPPGNFYPGFFNPAMFGMMNFPQQNYQGGMDGNGGGGGNNGNGNFDYFAQMAAMQRNNPYGMPHGYNPNGNPNYPSPSHGNYPNPSNPNFQHQQNPGNFSSMPFSQQPGGSNGGQDQMNNGMMQQTPTQASGPGPFPDTKEDNEQKQKAIEQLLSLQKDPPSQSAAPVTEEVEDNKPELESSKDESKDETDKNATDKEVSV